MTRFLLIVALLIAGCGEAKDPDGERRAAVYAALEQWSTDHDGRPLRSAAEADAAIHAPGVGYLPAALQGLRLRAPGDPARAPGDVIYAWDPKLEVYTLEVVRE